MPFGNLKSVVNAARDGKLPTDMIDVTAENSGDLTESVLCVKARAGGGRLGVVIWSCVVNGLCGVCIDGCMALGGKLFHGG